MNCLNRLTGTGQNDFYKIAPEILTFRRLLFTNIIVPLQKVKVKSDLFKYNGKVNCTFFACGASALKLPISHTPTPQTPNHTQEFSVTN